MAIIICMDGLAGDPETTFGDLKRELEGVGHKVILIDVEGIENHSDRINRVSNCYKEARRNSPEAKIFLAGQSAGGSAVRIATERMNENGPNGIILLSPAMPRFIWFGTWTLLHIMVKRFRDLLSKEIRLTDRELTRLLHPLPEKYLQKSLGNQHPISAEEARELAFFPPPFIGVNCPVLLIYGKQDRWIASKAQRKLAEMLKKKASVTEIPFEGLGHSTLISSRGHFVQFCIGKWIDR